MRRPSADGTKAAKKTVRFNIEPPTAAGKPEAIDQLFNYIINYRQGSAGGGLARMQSFLAFANLVQDTTKTNDFSALNKSVSSDWVYSSGLFGMCSTRYRDLMCQVLQTSLGDVKPVAAIRDAISTNPARQRQFEQAIASAHKHITSIRDTDERMMKARTFSMM